MQQVLPIFYKNVAPLTAAKHKGYSIEPIEGYGFAADTNSVYVSAVEFAYAARHYPIVFSGEDDKLFPAVLLGFREKENLFLNEDGSWDAEYVPSYVRRYPFIPAATGENGKYLVCIDEDFKGLNQEGKGQPLFTEDGEQSDYTKRVLRFLSDFQAEHERTQKLCSVLPDLGLLEDKHVKVELPNQKTYVLKGMKVVSREKLQQLPGSELSEMMSHGVLELIYYHLFSLNRMGDLLKRGASTVA